MQWVRHERIRGMPQQDQVPFSEPTFLVESLIHIDDNHPCLTDEKNCKAERSKARPQDLKVIDCIGGLHHSNRTRRRVRRLS
jgi:hypothetical protein